MPRTDVDPAQHQARLDTDRGADAAPPSWPTFRRLAHGPSPRRSRRGRLDLPLRPELNDDGKDRVAGGWPLRRILVAFRLRAELPLVHQPAPQLSAEHQDRASRRRWRPASRAPTGPVRSAAAGAVASRWAACAPGQTGRPGPHRQPCTRATRMRRYPPHLPGPTRSICSARPKTCAPPRASSPRGTSLHPVSRKREAPIRETTRSPRTVWGSFQGAGRLYGAAAAPRSCPSLPPRCSLCAATDISNGTCACALHAGARAPRELAVARGLPGPSRLAPVAFDRIARRDLACAAPDSATPPQPRRRRPRRDLRPDLTTWRMGRSPRTSRASHPARRHGTALPQRLRGVLAGA